MVGQHESTVPCVHQATAGAVLAGGECAAGLSRVGWSRLLPNYSAAPETAVGPDRAPATAFIGLAGWSPWTGYASGWELAAWWLVIGATIVACLWGTPVVRRKRAHWNARRARGRDQHGRSA